MSRVAVVGVFMVASLPVASSLASTYAPADSARVLRDIERLGTTSRVLYVAAHPDDENTRLLSWLVENQHVRAAYLSLTRGEGGQNLLGSEQAPLLGVIRTQELLAARDIDGAEQLFGLERDFGYSKSADETLRIWGHDDALGDVVWAIRRFQPDVIITRFSPADHETHGHHTASAQLALEAFTAAADPKAFPAQLKFVQPWQAKRIVWNKGIFGTPKAHATDGFLGLDIGGYDPLLGTSAGEVAARSRSMHKSQGFGASPQRGETMEYFRILAGAPMQHTFLDGVDGTWASVPGADKLAVILERARTQFDARHPSASIPTLLEALAALEVLPDSDLKTRKRVDLSETIARCAGLYLDGTTASPSTVPGTPFKVSLAALNRSDVPAVVHAVRMVGHEEIVDKPLPLNQLVTLENEIKLPAGQPLSEPYWLAESPTPGRWQVTDQTLVSRPEQPPPLEAEFVVVMGGHTLTLRRAIGYTWNDPVAGERRRPLEVLPPVTINVHDPVLVFPDASARELRVSVRAALVATSGTLFAQAPSGFAVDPPAQPFSVAVEGEQELVFKLTPPATLANQSDSKKGAVTFSARLQSGEVVSRGVRRIDYSHIPIETLTPPAVVQLVRFEMKRALTRIGYIPGAGDEVPQALRQAGYAVTMLSDEALASKSLHDYEAIVVGVRAFNTNDRLARYHDTLMDYVSAGGVLLVQYNTQNRISKIVGPIGPWPFNISQDRVTEENAKVEQLINGHPRFQSPNRITDTDFESWIQERGLYFADTWDSHYEPLLSMHDAGEPPRKGSVLVARYGKGSFIYTGLAFFRQLPAGVPGAYRLFANLLSNAP